MLPLTKAFHRLQASGNFGSAPSTPIAYSGSTALQQTGAVVIVSSSWRKKHALSEIISILESRGFRGEVAGATSANGTLSRTEEIAAWLKENRSPGAAYVVVDDELTSGLPAERVISPSNQTGLTDKDVEQAIAILTGMQ